jgi:hypothetical protein
MPGLWQRAQRDLEVFAPRLHGGRYWAVESGVAVSKPKTVTVGGIEFEPITSPGPCSICGKPADGMTGRGSPDGREWQLCGDRACSDAADKQQEAHGAPAVDAGDQGGDRTYLLLTLQWIEEKLRQHPDHPTLKGQRSALIGAVDRAMPPAENVPGPIFQKAGPEAVALRLRHADVSRAKDALGDYFSDRPEIGNDAQLCQLALDAESALTELREAISTKLRKLCGVEP